MTDPYTFASPEKAKADLERFLADAARWKPGGFNADADKRLSFYLYRQRDLLVAELKKRYPKSWEEIAPVTLPVTRFFVRELSKVFLQGASIALLDAEKKPVKEDSGEAAAWSGLLETLGLGLKLKQIDRYATLLETAFLKLGHSEAGVAAHVVFPHHVEAVMDAAFPLDLDRAHLVAVEIASDAGPAGIASMEGRRWEVWCARPNEELHAIVRGNGTVEFVDKAYPYRDATGRAIVPLVAFAQHTEELGLFPLVGQGLADFNLAVDVAVTGLFEIAETQGWGELAVTVPMGASVPPEIPRGPRRAIALKDGVTAAILNYNAPIADLIQKLDQDLKREALLYGIPPGSVSLEARTVASGVALQIEMRPLLESRQDAVDAYRLPMRRLGALLQVVWNAWAEGAKQPVFPTGWTTRWDPGEVQMPDSEDAVIDRMVVLRKQGWASDAEIVAKLRKLTPEQAREILAQIKAEDPPKPDPLMEDPLLPFSGKKKPAGEPPEEPEDDPEAPPTEE